LHALENIDLIHSLDILPLLDTLPQEYDEFLRILDKPKIICYHGPHETSMATSQNMYVCFCWFISGGPLLYF